MTEISVNSETTKKPTLTNLWQSVARSTNKIATEAIKMLPRFRSRSYPVPRVWIEAQCEGPSMQTLRVENLTPFSFDQIHDSFIADECLGFKLLFRDGECNTFSLSSVRGHQMVVTYLFQKDTAQQLNSELQTSVLIDFLISWEDGETLKTADGAITYTAQEARKIFLYALFDFADHLRDTLEKRHAEACRTNRIPDYFSLGKVANKGGKIYDQPAMDNLCFPESNIVTA